MPGTGMEPVVAAGDSGTGMPGTGMPFVGAVVGVMPGTAMEPVVAAGDSGAAGAAWTSAPGGLGGEDGGLARGLEPDAEDGADDGGHLAKGVLGVAGREHGCGSVCGDRHGQLLDGGEVREISRDQL